MKRILGCLLLTTMMTTAGAQRVLTLDSCRALALRNNKQLAVSRVKQEVAANIRKAARTKYLPHVNALGGYEWTSREISLLSDEQKEKFSNLGSTIAGDIQTKAADFMQTVSPAQWQALGQLGITPQVLQQNLSSGLQDMAGLLNAGGQRLVNALSSDTRNMFAGAIMLTQPVFMGGAIIAMNKMADIAELLAANSAEGKLQSTLYNIDQAYWQVVSLRHKQKLAQSYLELVKKFDGDVQKMIEEGVATRSQGLSVRVKVNEAEMTLTKVNDGLVLSKMLLCQLCGLPVSEQVTLVDENTENLSSEPALVPQISMEQVASNRPELKMLQNVVDLSKQTTRILKAGNLPQVLLTGGYAVSNPNLYNGFQHKFTGVWNVGVMMRVPIWNWGDVAYKVRASKGATAIASLELDEAREKIELQVNQSAFRVNEANKKLEMAKTSTLQADENLRTANVGFAEGVISPSTVLEAQTAWLQAQSQKIDAEIDVKMSQVNLQKALGTLQ